MLRIRLTGCLPAGSLRSGAVSAAYTYRRALSDEPTSFSGLWKTTPEDLSPVNYGDRFDFRVEKQLPGGGKSGGAVGARLGTIVTPHGTLQTPAFVFCATKAAVKGTTIASLKREQTQIILSNTFHMMNRPGAALVAEMGGLHSFMGWDGPMLTDSGGYQIFSMAGNRVGNEIKGGRSRGGTQFSTPTPAVTSASASGSNRDNSDGHMSSAATDSSGSSAEDGSEHGSVLVGISEEGATFRSYVDGSKHLLSPEESMWIQRQLGADLVVVLDECTPFHVEPTYTELSMNRSHRWALRSLRAFRKHHDGTQALYGIVQGGVHHELRDQSVDFINSLPFFGIAIGGSLGDSVQTMHDIVTYTRQRIGHTTRPVHLLGIGGIVDIFNGVRQGIDTFDCVMPTRAARHGNALVMTRHWDSGGGVSDEASGMGLRGGNIVTSSNADSLPSDHLHLAQVESIDKVVKSIRAQLLRLEKIQVSAFESSKLVAGGSRSGGKTAAKGALKTDSQRRRLLADLDKLMLQRADLIQLPGHRVGATSSAASKPPTVRDHISLTKATMRRDPRPIDAKCECYTCSGAGDGKGFSRAYLHHLFKAEPSLAGSLVSMHNIHFMNKMMERIRMGIATDTLDEVESMYVHGNSTVSSDEEAN